MRRQYRGRPERFLRDHAEDDALRLALAEGTPAAIAAAVSRIQHEEAAALDQRRTPGHDW